MCNISKIVVKNTNHQKPSKPSRKLFGTFQTRFGTKKKLILIFEFSCCKYVKALTYFSPKVKLSFRVLVFVFRTSKYQKRVFWPAKRFSLTGSGYSRVIFFPKVHYPKPAYRQFYVHAHDTENLELPSIHMVSVHVTRCRYDRHPGQTGRGTAAWAALAEAV